MNSNSEVCFLYPGDVIQPKKVDEQYAAEAECMRQHGFATALVSIENIKEGIRKLSSDNVMQKYLVVYRGWMLSQSSYRELLDIIQQHGWLPATTSDHYLLTHHLPNWYPLLKDYTPETKIFPHSENISAELTKLGWEQFFIKDYVKSLKTSIGSFIKSADEVNIVIDEMKKYRGTIEGGLCVRRVEHYKENSENRYFVINNHPYSAQRDENIPRIVYECAKRIYSPFFSVDVVMRDDEQLRIVEVGDGQVSDLVGWTEHRFAEIWQTAIKQHAFVNTR